MLRLQNCLVPIIGLMFFLASAAFGSIPHDVLFRSIISTAITRTVPGNAVRWFVWSNGRLLAQVQSNGTIRIALSDELGRTVSLADSSGALVDEFCYSPYGRLIAHSGTTATPLSWLGAFGVWDAGHGLYLTRHRAYDSNLARFASRDPAGLAGGLNLYALAGGSPLAWIDPLGLCWEEPETWFSQAPQQSSGYNSPVLRAPTSAAEQQHWTDMSYGRVPVTQADYVQAQVNAAIMETAVLTALGGKPSPKSTPVNWNPINGPGPLGNQVASTFRSATYTELTTSEATTLYRVYGGNSPQLGPYWTRTAPSGPLQSTIDSALNPAWGNTANNVVTIQVPTGTKIFEGVAAPQGGLLGGGNQVFIQTVNPTWIVP